MSNDSSKIEALLFTEGGPITKKKLAQMLGTSVDAISKAVIELAEQRRDSGVVVIDTETEASLAVAANEAKTVEDAFGEDASREIGDAGLEVLSIVLYRGPSTRSAIDYIRGVNTSSTIRTLTARGLVERTANPEDAREYLYRPTSELLAHLGVRKGDELPDYGKITNELAAFETSQKAAFDEHADTTIPDAS